MQPDASDILEVLARASPVAVVQTADGQPERTGVTADADTSPGQGDGQPALAHTLAEVRERRLDEQQRRTRARTRFVTPERGEHSTIQSAGLVLVFFGLALLLTLRTRDVARRALALQAEVTRRIEAERRLKAREARFRQVFNQAVNGFVLHRADGTCVAANPAACRLFGLDHDTLLQTPRQDLGLPDAPQPTSSEPLLCTRANGDHFAAQVDEVTYSSESGPRILTSLVDLTALVDAQNKERHLRRQLASAQRLEAIGRLAGGLAHDMNNVLAVISNNIDLLEELTAERGAAASQEVVLCLEDARAGVVRGSSMIRQLLAFSQQEVAAPQTVDPEAVLRSMQAMLSQLLPEGRTLEVVLQPVSRVQMSPTDFEQVLLNLVLNASDAVGPEGTVRVALGTDPQAATVVLSVEDDGTGIDADALDHLFEPFCTTKPVWEGPGLGLPTVKAVVERVRGTITVQTGPGGTRFDVRLPAHNGVAKTPDPLSVPSQGDGSLILLVDDDTGVRRSVRRQLSRAGWRVEDYRDPLQARDRLLGDDAPPALLVTDVLMPGLNGRQLAKLATQRHPGLKVLFISGYTGNVLGEGSTDGHPLLPKPFQREALLRTVHRLVHARRPDPRKDQPKAAQA